jgi:flavorubredoxin
MVIDGFIESPRLPRELAPGLTWLGVCTSVPHEGIVVHSYHSLYLLSGEDASLLVDTGNPKDWVAVERQLRALLAAGRPPLRYVFTTHTEVPHSGNLARLLDAFPGAIAVGDVRDLHLVFPRFADRLRPTAAGDAIDLGGRTFEVVPAVIRDLPTSLWGYDASGQVLFTGDGFAYMHHHLAEECGLVAEEMPDLPLGEFSAVFNSYALYWTRFTDIRPYFDRLGALMERHPTRLIAPGHGSPLRDPAQTVPRVREGLLEYAAAH